MKHPKVSQLASKQNITYTRGSFLFSVDLPVVQRWILGERCSDILDQTNQLRPVVGDMTEALRGARDHRTRGGGPQWVRQLEHAVDHHLSADPRRIQARRFAVLA